MAAVGTLAVAEDEATVEQLAGGVEEQEATECTLALAQAQGGGGGDDGGGEPAAAGEGESGAAARVGCTAGLVAEPGSCTRSWG